MTDRIFVIFAILTCVAATFHVTLPTNALFQNTLKRWDVTVLSPKDRGERWERFVKAQKNVERTTSAILLESLNYFTILNDDEWDRIVKPMTRNRNVNNTLSSEYRSQYRSQIKRKRRDIPATLTYWEEIYGLTPAQDQKSCGSCWSFPATGAIEAVYKQLTGELVDFSEQYFVDCSSEGSGCDGGTTKSGFELTKVRQYMVLESDLPYTGSYSGCTLTEKINSRTGNGLDKIWIADFIPLSESEEGFLDGLGYSPVAFSCLIGDGLMAYSGGLFEDVDCVKDNYAHAMLLVGYTETELRIKASYGERWGENGYMRYKRGSSYLTSCNYYKAAYAVYSTLRRDLEYEFCNDNKVGTFDVCKASCDAKNTDSITGWTLATVPTVLHNQLLVDKANALIPGVKGDDKFNYFWIGFMDPSKNGLFYWLDGYSEVLYTNISSKAVGSGTKGILNKNTGKWNLENKATATYRGFCSRAVNCWNFVSYINHGVVTFDKADLTEGTIATVTCDEGYVMKGEKLHTCTGGLWKNDANDQEDFPFCKTPGGTGATCTKPTVSNGSIQPDSATIADGAEYTVTCSNAFTMSGDAQVTCTNGVLSAAPTCLKGATCTKPTVSNGSIQPDSATIADGAQYTVTCNNDFAISGDAQVTCTNGVLSAAPTCSDTSAGATCTKPTVSNGSIQPDSATIADGAQYTVTCNNDFAISGDAQVTCTNGVLSAAPTCSDTSAGATCTKPTVSNGSIQPDSATIADGAQYTVTCNNDFAISGDAQVTCTNGVLSAAPTCSDTSAGATCTKPTVSNGSIQPDSATIADGAQYTVTCSNAFTISGDAQVTCTNGALSAAPTCLKAVNSNCPEYQVTNGAIEEDTSTFTTDQVATVKCSFGYTLSGTNPRICTDPGWSSGAQTCDKNEICMELADPANGKATCTGTGVGSTCTLSCDINYFTRSEITKVTCLNTLLWSHQTSSNSKGIFEPCVQKKEPESRILSSTLTLKTDYCRTTQEETKLVKAFDDFMKALGSIICMSNGNCQVQNSVCKNENSQSKVTYELKQTDAMTDESVLSKAQSAMETMVANNAVTFEVTSPSRKRATITFTADEESYVSAVVTTCPAGDVMTGDICYTCPAGYKTSSGCSACEAGSYNPTAGSATCTACTDDKTTYSTGATTSDQCLNLCTVPKVLNGELNAPVDFKVDTSQMLSLTCNSGYETENSILACSSISKSAKCTATESSSNTTTVVVVIVVLVLVIAIIGLLTALWLKKKQQHREKSNRGCAYEATAEKIDIADPAEECI